MPNFLKNNVGWLITLTITLVSLLVSLGFGYRGIKAEIEKVSAVQILLSEVQRAQDAKIVQLQSITSTIVPDVQENKNRMNQLQVRFEVFMLDSTKDRAKLNADIDTIKAGLDKLLILHIGK
jgi:hypothetical protein